MPAKPSFATDVLSASVATPKISETVRRTYECVHERAIEQLGGERIRSARTSRRSPFSAEKPHFFDDVDPVHDRYVRILDDHV